MPFNKFSITILQELKELTKRFLSITFHFEIEKKSKNPAV